MAKSRKPKAAPQYDPGLDEVNREMLNLKKKFLLLVRLIILIIRELVEINQKLIRLKRKPVPPIETEIIQELRRLSRLEVKSPQKAIGELEKLVARLEQ
ncbi:MAG TPA: hypothetical protein VGL29_14865 [Blastocatellia bacterium]|jgi:hypothetical protein